MNHSGAEVQLEDHKIYEIARAAALVLKCAKRSMAKSERSTLSQQHINGENVSFRGCLNRKKHVYTSKKANISTSTFTEIRMKRLFVLVLVLV